MWAGTDGAGSERSEHGSVYRIGAGIVFIESASVGQAIDENSKGVVIGRAALQMVRWYGNKKLSGC